MSRFKFTLISLFVCTLYAIATWQYRIVEEPSLAVEQFRQHDSSIMIRATDTVDAMGWVWTTILVGIAYDAYRGYRKSITPQTV